MTLIPLVVLLLTSVTVCMGEDSAGNALHLAYKSLRSNILARDVVVNKIPIAVEANGTVTGAEPMNLLMVPFHILSIDEVKQVMHVIVFIQVSWKHRQLAWSPADYEGIESIMVDTCSMWTPSILVYIGVEESIEIKFADTLKVTHQGAVSSEKNYQLSFRCVIDFDKYPFDTQLCSLGFYPSSRPTAPLELISTEDLFLIYNNLNFSGEWNLRKLHHHEKVSTNLLLPTAKYPDYIFELERRSAYYVITIIFPMVMTSAMIPLVFVIPTKTGEKISYLVAIFTSTAIFLNYICDVMPRSLLSVPYLAVLLLEVMVEGFLATLASLWVVKKFESEENKQLVIKGSPMMTPMMTPMKTPMMTTIKVQSCSVAPMDKNEEKTAAISTHDDSTHRHISALTSQRLDHILLVCFTSGQTLFLLALFLMTDWIL